MNLFLELDGGDTPDMLRAVVRQRFVDSCRGNGFEPNLDTLHTKLLRKLPKNWKGGRPEPGETVVQCKAFARPIPKQPPVEPTKPQAIKRQVEVSGKAMVGKAVAVAQARAERRQRSLCHRAIEWVRAQFHRG